MTKHVIVTRDDLLAQGCEEVVSRRGRGAFVIGEEIIAIDCTECSSLKYRSDFVRNKTHFLGVYSSCKECRQMSNRKYRQDNREKELERKRKYHEANPEKEAERKRKHRENNPEMYLLKKQRRRARKLALPYDLTAEQQDAISAAFNGKCALTGEPIDLHLDHVIPISVGHGGTTYGNMIPLSAELNLSKRASHIFEWFEANRNRFNLSQRKFDALIEYLAQANEMTTQEYRTYVDWCFDNPRDVGELQDAV